jgi:hypothetical protein
METDDAKFSRRSQNGVAAGVLAFPRMAAKLKKRF